MATKQTKVVAQVATRKQNSQFGETGCYTCANCGKKTRQTGHPHMAPDSELCAKCFDLATLENEHNDLEHDGKFNPKCPHCVREDKERAKMGGRYRSRPVEPAVVHPVVEVKALAIDDKVIDPAPKDTVVVEQVSQEAVAGKIKDILTDIRSTLKQTKKADDFAAISRAMWPKKGEKIGQKKQAEAKDIPALKIGDSILIPAGSSPIPAVAVAKDAKEAKKVPHCCLCRKAGQKNKDTDVRMSYVRAADPKLNKIFMRGNLCRAHRLEIVKDKSKKVLIEGK